MYNTIRGRKNKVIDKEINKVYINPNIGKGSTDMYLFAANNSYNSKQTMHNHKHGLNVVCEYFSYGEK